MTASPTQRMAKWLAKHLKIVEDVVCQNVINDSFEFVEIVRNLDLSKQIMASLDISSLFTQVPLEETVDMIIDLINSEDLDVGIPNDLLREMILLCTKDVAFTFNNETYVQHDGVAMGSPLGPCLANIFVGILERKHHLEIFANCKKYLRYVDDTFVVCRDVDQVYRLQTVLNSFHPNLQFTVEIEDNNQLPFLDVLVIRDSEKTKTKTYRKSTWSGIFLHFHSFTPLAYKIGLVRTLFDRLRKICSAEFVAEEARFLKAVLYKNGYPPDFVDSHSKPPKLRPFGPDKKKVFLELPFLGDQLADKYNKLIKKSISEAYFFIQPQVIWKCRRIPQRSLKDSTPANERRGIIYNFQCACSSTYVGRTSRTLDERVKEHVPRWLKTGRTMPPRSTNLPKSSITQHLTSCTYADLAHLHSYFSTLYDRVPGFKAHILEALLIGQRLPDLCRQKNGVYRLLLPW